MLSFKSFIVEKAYELNAQENKQVEGALNAYERYFGQENLSVYNAMKRFSDVIKDNRMLINTIKYFDNETKEENYVPVYVSFEDFAADAAYERKENVIELYYKHFNKLTTLMKRNKIVHELLHAKQHYKTLTPEYRRALNKRTLPSGRETIRSERGYFLSPSEYPVQLASLIHEMDRQYMLILQNLKKGSNRKFWENQRTGFLRLLDKFIRSPKIVSDQDLPNYLKNEVRFLKALFRNKDNPQFSKYYKDFKKKLYFYYQRLQAADKKKLDSSEELA